MVLHNILIILLIGSSLSYFSSQTLTENQNNIIVDSFTLRAPEGWNILTGKGGEGVFVWIVNDHERGNVLLLDFDKNKGDNTYAYVIKNGAGMGGSWHGYEGVSLWVKGDGTASKINLEIAANKWKEYYQYGIFLYDNTWHKLVIPWNDFKPIGNYSLNIDEVNDLRLTIRGESWTKMRLLVDDIQIEKRISQ